HSGHLLAVASLPKTPEADLSSFAPRTALGIDAERNDREQVLKIRDRFLSDDEKAMIPADNLEANIIAWTAKEALYKAGMTEGLDLRKDITIISLPAIDRKMNLPGAPAPILGKARLSLPVSASDKDSDKTSDNSSELSADLPESSRRKEYEMELYTYESETETDTYIVTLAYSPKCAKYSRKNA
ncbi:MAG: 4'-phosphopantetheinyl transferase superfamily protein, partial [Muribaculaceae bacterium]|nr:4'-phosphopantetheinyl transferase superfamily protein [Muribaculaceae bacterium]